MQTKEYDFIIVGAGLAGLALALKVAPLGRVALVSKTPKPYGNSAMAQGGIAAVVSSGDSFEEHINDTLKAGDGLCNPEVVESIICQGPDRIADLIAWGVKFDRIDANNFSLHREGGHGLRRVLHIDDQTGKAIHDQLLFLALNSASIDFYHSHIGLDLIVQEEPHACWGLSALDLATNKLVSFLAPATILASGGAGKTYLYTSNWEGATGDGIAMASRAGAIIKNMEFMQFHPTCLYHSSARNFLITEALRGERAVLKNRSGVEFMLGIHPLGSLAPRDIVARSIDLELKKTGAECVFLDCTSLGKDFLTERFPAIYRKCKELGFEMDKSPIPVVPAAHYLIGGIAVNLNGQTNIPNLFAIGETACTGLHGANRLASNSLLECLALAHNCSEHFKVIHLGQIPPILQREIAAKIMVHAKRDKSEDDLALINHLWDEIRLVMWTYVGIVRSNARLKRARERIAMIQAEIRDYFESFELSSDLIELRNLAQVSELMIEGAAKRTESRGAHFNIDYP